MNYKNDKRDPKGMTERNSRSASSRCRPVDEYRGDNKRDARLAELECKFCFYLAGRIGGCAMTSANCGECQKDMMFGSTCVDYCCQDCAKAKGICKHCGAEMD